MERFLRRSVALPILGAVLIGCGSREPALPIEPKAEPVPRKAEAPGVSKRETTAASKPARTAARPHPAPQPSSRSKGKLDGRSYAIRLFENGVDAGSDTLVFTDGMFESVTCRGYGFPKAPYTTWKEKTTRGRRRMRFAATATSLKEGTASWSGAVSTRRIAGKMTWFRGDQEIRHVFKGDRLKSRAAMGDEGVRK